MIANKLSDETQAPILVTGASGFIALHTIIQLLLHGYKVRGTLRSLRAEKELRATVAKHVAADAQLEFVAAELMQDSGWDLAVRGCEFVAHIASPFPILEPKDENDLIAPAVEGTMRVMRAAHHAKCKSVVLLSSNAAISAGHRGENRTFTESDWSRLDGDIGAYAKSKTLAERAAWDFINGPQNMNKLEMVSINPPLVFGPLLSAHMSTSGEIIRVFMRGEVPAVARIRAGLVDVRDVAAAVLLAIRTPAASGSRFLCAADTLWYKQIVDILRDEFPDNKKIPRLVFPNMLVRAMAHLDKRIARVAVDLDWDYQLSNEHARRVLGFSPRPARDAITSMANSLRVFGLV